MKNKSYSRNRGFTLLEVLVAVAILGVGIIAVMGLFPQSLRAARAAAERNAAATAAGSALSQLRALDNISEMRAWINKNTMDGLTAAEAVYAIYDDTGASVTRLPGTNDVFRVTYRVKMTDGRYESFVTYVTEH
ncbi:MAG: prepilin-type N-terminal cleavage/methylation domain-containing protein [Candidatus Hydrogenedentes bacterium]|nr:prepilin-type N-terminal cleavage/methylation domain-containing protein [Candidatus Hydrogenedentota bacterium]